MSDQDQIELLIALEQQFKHRCKTDLNTFCSNIEIPSAPMVEDSCPKGDSCDDPKCELHEVSTAFYPQTVEPAKHHRILNDALQKMAFKIPDPKTGKIIDRLMVFMPYGSAKSTYATVTFPPFHMGNFPNKNIICTSYATGLAKKFGRKVRSICESYKYKELFETSTNRDNRAVNDWSLDNGATYMCGGILSGITGNRADGILIDDPIKGRQDADSPTIRASTWEAYLSDIRTRLKPNGWLAIIQTRWHEDDLSGRILPDNWNGESGWITAKDGEWWYVLCIQAQCTREDDPLGREIGEWIWPEWFSTEYWEGQKRLQGSRNFSALAQQIPKPSEGGVLKKAWFKRYRTRPDKFKRVFISADTASKEQELNDPSVFQLWGETEEQDLYLLDVWRDRVAFPELKRKLGNFFLKHSPDCALIEDKSSGQSLIQEAREGLIIQDRPTKLYIPIVAIEPKGSKLDRAVRVSPFIESGKIYIPESADWLIDFESEVFGYPLSTHDDQVDALTQAIDWARNTSLNIQVESTGRRVSAGSQIEQSSDSFRIRSNNDFSGF